MIALRSRYFTELTNILEWIVLISAFGYLYSFLFMEATSENTELLFGVCCMFFGWLNVLLFLRRSPLFNIYVVMFTQVILTLIRVLFVFTPLLLAFALAFNQLFIRQTVFKDIWNSYMKTFVMFMGEMEYGETLPNSLGKKDESALFHLVPLPSVSYILYAVFIIMIPVAMMNLLVSNFLLEIIFIMCFNLASFVYNVFSNLIGFCLYPFLPTSRDEQRMLT